MRCNSVISLYSLKCLNPAWMVKYVFPSSTIMMTSSNGNIFRVTGPLCGEFTSPGEFPTQRPVTRSFDVFFDLRLNKRLSKQPWGWWFETLSWSLWRQCNDEKLWYCLWLSCCHLCRYWLTTCSATSDTKVGFVATLGFQCLYTM